MRDHGAWYGTKWRTVGYWVYGANGEQHYTVDLEWKNDKYGSLWHADANCTYREETGRMVPMSPYYDHQKTAREMMK